MTTREYKKMMFMVEDLIRDNEYVVSDDEKALMRAALQNAYVWGYKLDKKGMEIRKARKCIA